jgi:O-antigen/teichoic acid export membrane protein
MTSRLSRNVVSNVAQTIISSILLFALYRYININLGVEKLGVWAVVLSTISVSRLIDLGMSAGVTRFVARDRARGDSEKAAQVIDTSFLIMWGAVGLFLPALYSIIKYVLPEFLEGGELIDAIIILPYALFSLWLTVGSTVFLSGLAGCERMDLQASVVIAGQILLMVLAMLLVPQHGLSGLAYAQIGQALLTLTVGRLLLCRVLPSLPRLPRSWAKPVFKELLSYGANVQAATVAQLVFDISTKLMMARFGAATAVGYFEMVNQLVMRVRMVIVSANQAIIPHVAGMTEREPDKLSDFYRANIRVLTFVALPVFTLLFSWSGAFSWLLTGGFQPQFMDFLWIICTAWFINIFTAPAYFINMGTGQIKWNTLAHVTMAIINICIGFVVGHYFGAIGVVISYAVALSTGSVLLIYRFSLKISDATLVRAKVGFGARIANATLIVVCSIFIIAAWLHPIHLTDSLSADVVLRSIIPPFALGLLMWLHPTRQVIMEKIKKKISSVPT